MPSEEPWPQPRQRAQIIDLSTYRASVRDATHLHDLALECLFCGTQHGDQRAVLACEEGHYWDVVNGLAARERSLHLREALRAANERGQLSSALAAMVGAMTPQWAHEGGSPVIDLTVAMPTAVRTAIPG